MGKQTNKRNPGGPGKKVKALNRTPHQTSANDWIFQNRGKVAEIGRRLGVTGQFVYMVLMGKRGSRGERVEKALKRAGAPSLEAKPQKTGAM